MTETRSTYRAISDPPEEVEIEVTEKDYQRELAEGVSENEALKPGPHTFRRGGFKTRHLDFEINETPTKVRVNIYLDLDVVNFFKERAKSPDAARYQTQINNALRSVMASERGYGTYSQMVRDDRFISAVAEKVAEYQVERRPSKPPRTTRAGTTRKRRK